MIRNRVAVRGTASAIQGIRCQGRNGAKNRKRTAGARLENVVQAKLNPARSPFVFIRAPLCDRTQVIRPMVLGE